MSWLPEKGDIVMPYGLSHGAHALVLESEDDRVKILRTDPGFKPYEVENRLSVFLDRYEFIAKYREPDPVIEPTLVVPEESPELPG